MVPRRCAHLFRSGYIRYVVPLVLIACFTWYLAFQPLRAKQTAVVSLKETFDLTIASMKVHYNQGPFAAIRTNVGKTTGSTVCVVDPAIINCKAMGFAAFVLHTLDHIVACRALGINQTTVLWRACNSVCSQDPKVNSWNWYFHPVNQGLESKVEKVLCPVKIDVTSILDNSFRDRNDVKGYEKSKIITTQERMRVNELISQYVKPNSRIREKVMMFHRRYLEGFTVLGVQVRGTDHWKETSEQRLPSLMSGVKRAQEILETLPRPRKIFIASDNNEIIQKFLPYFGKETVSFGLLLFSMSHSIERRLEVQP